MKTQTAETQAALTPAQALTMLKEGNKRFQQNIKSDRDLLQQVKETSYGQYPFAVVLSCIDSRVPAELIFDQGIGDIFNVRIAGNFVNDDILGSMEFGCKVAGSKLILVLGHTSCGAVKGVCNQVKLGNLTGMLEKLQPAVDAVEVEGERNGSNAEFVQKVSEKNVELTIQKIKEKSPVLKEMLDQGDIDVVGGMYDVVTGKVEFYS
uniref:Carbonic anhydrase family protein n=1 Tax=Roseihalotalea indica TaxID=2867963 RepID=A0AA49JDE4_9BACT|nr:carbonic anhydrase family protein [Tunicatimonas sp. TK19036]